jgi:hypothetical protein
MRVLVLCGLWASGGAFGASLSDDARAFVAGEAAQYTYSVALPSRPTQELKEVYRQTRALVLQTREEDWSRNHRMLTVMSEIARRNEAGDFDTLIDDFEAMPAARSYLKGQFGAMLLEARAVHLVLGLADQRAPAALPPVTDEPPSHVKPAVLPAWMAYRSLAEIKPGPSPEPVFSQENWSHLHGAMADLLRGKPWDHAEVIRRFEWGGMCGTGSQQLYEPRGRALFIASVLAGDWSDAAWYALQAAPSGRSATEAPDWAATYLTWAGLLPEQLFLGAAVDAFDTRFLGALGQLGGADAARAVLAASTITPLEHQDSWRQGWLSQLHAFVEPEPRPLQGTILFTGSGGGPSIAASEVPKDLQREVLQALIDALGPHSGPDSLRTAAQQLRKLRRPEAKAALEWALTSSNHEVAKTAAEALTAMGHETLLEPLGNTDFLILVNDQPLQEGRLRWQVHSGNTSRSSSWTLDASAVGRIDRTYLDGSGRTIDRIEIETEQVRAPSDPWFRVSMPLPADLSQPVNVRVHTAPLTLAFNGVDLAPDAAAHVKLVHRYGDGATQIAHPSLMGFTTSAHGLVLEQLQLGDYQITVTVDGAAAVQTERFVLHAGGTVRAIALSPGGTLRFELDLPGGEEAERPRIELKMLDAQQPDNLPDTPRWQTDATMAAFRVPGQAHAWRGLPLGTYALHILSSEDKRRTGREGHMPALHPHKGLVREVKIDGEVDLGVLTLR